MEPNPARALMETISELERRTGELQRRIVTLEEERGSLYDQNQSMKRDLDEFRERVETLIGRIEELERGHSAPGLF